MIDDVVPVVAKQAYPLSEPIYGGGHGGFEPILVSLSKFITLTLLTALLLKSTKYL